jgi:hypothetical protein
MRQLTIEQFTNLIGAHDPPCISLYQPTHRRHPANEQDPIRYRNLLVKMESSLREQYPTREVRTMLEAFQTLARDNEFWNHRTEGLAIFSSPEKFEVVELQRPVRELLVVADSFHTKPLIRILQSADRFHILCLDRQEVKLYEGNRDALDPVELTSVPATIADVLGNRGSPATQMADSPGTQSGGGATAVRRGQAPRTHHTEADVLRFFREVDRKILEHESRPSGLPLMLAALPESLEAFRRISENPFLLPAGITVNPDSLSLDQLREQAWKQIEPFYVARLEGLKEKFHTARSRQAASADLSDVAKAAAAGRVETLLVEADRIIPGELDRATGAIRLGEQAAPHVDDMLDDLAELVLVEGGEVVIVPTERMPTKSGLAAIFRF